VNGSPKLGWQVSCFFLLFSLPGLYDHVFNGHHSVGNVVAALSGFAVYGAGYALSSIRMWHRRLRARLALCATMLAAATLLVWLMGPDSTWLFVYALAIVGVMLPPLVAGFVGLPVLALLGAYTIAHFGVGLAFSGHWIMLLSVFVATWFMGRLIRANHDLIVAQEEIARLAAAEERARLAEELREQLGRGLTAITEQVGVACAELAAGHQNPDRVREVEDLARQAVTQVRATVSGYRTASLAAEVVGARAALEAAGIAADLPTAVDRVAPAYREAFALALRDGVTAVLGHSGATSCQVRLGESWLEVRDNGTASVSEVRSKLVERIEGIGGRVDAGPRAGGGFWLRVAVPS
jgi:two-component system, NarL family, sensor histidine kinase DesK